MDLSWKRAELEKEKGQCHKTDANSNYSTQKN